jgi:hypothetical protein
MMELTIENVLRQINEGINMAREKGVVCGPVKNLRIKSTPPNPTHEQRRDIEG